MAEQQKEKGFSLAAVLAEIEAGRPVPCYLLTGGEDYLLREALGKIVSGLIPDRAARESNLFTLEGRDEDPDALCNLLSEVPLFGGRKVVVVRDTRLFESKALLVSLVERIKAALSEDPDRAAAAFLKFLGLSGLELDDVRGGAWERIDEDLWRRFLPDEHVRDLGTWLPRAVELAEVRGGLPDKGHEEGSDRLARLLEEGLPSQNHLILTAEAPDRRKRLFKTISAVGRVLNFPKVKGEAKQEQLLREMAASYLRSQGKSLTEAAWAALGQRTGFSLRESMAEIQKLVAYSGDRRVVDAPDVEALVGRTREESVFGLSEALAGGDLQIALRILAGLLEQGGQPLMIVAMLGREIRLLLQARELISAGQVEADPRMDYGRFQKVVLPRLQKEAPEGLFLISQHPFVVYQALKNASAFTKEELAGYLEMLWETDLAIKTTSRDGRLLLERFLVAVCRRRRGRR